MPDDALSRSALRRKTVFFGCFFTRFKMFSQACFAKGNPGIFLKFRDCTFLVVLLRQTAFRPGGRGELRFIGFRSALSLLLDSKGKPSKKLLEFFLVKNIGFSAEATNRLHFSLLIENIGQILFAQACKTLGHPLFGAVAKIGHRNFVKQVILHSGKRKS